MNVAEIVYLGLKMDAIGSLEKSLNFTSEKLGGPVLH